MLIPRTTLDGIARGDVTLAFRRWDRPRVRPGTRLRTAVGVVAVESVTQVDPGGITDAEARLAGYADSAALLRFLDRRGGADPGAGADVRARPTFRIGLRHAGEDPRVALRERSDLTPDDADALLARLARLDAASRHGPWTARVLRLIGDRPGVRAADLAASLGREKLPFKTDVRKLKELGLTESLEVGYRLSPRGSSLLSRLSRAAR